MSGAMRKMGVYLGLLEDTGRYDEEYYAPAAGGEQVHDVPAQRGGGATVATAHPAAGPAPSGATVASLAERRRPVSSAPVVTELSRITTLHPTTYNEARTLGENFREGTPVIMNLSEMDDADAKRLVDFAAGLVFAVHGSIERITNKVFLLSPPNVAVAAEDKQRIAENGFFNQS
jgi:cell division inhibitor SepF